MFKDMFSSNWSTFAHWHRERKLAWDKFICLTKSLTKEIKFRVNLIKSRFPFKGRFCLLQNMSVFYRHVTFYLIKYFET